MARSSNCDMTHEFIPVKCAEATHLFLTMFDVACIGKLQKTEIRSVRK